MNGWAGSAALTALLSLVSFNGLAAAADASSTNLRGNAYWLLDRQSGCYVLYGDSRAADSVSWFGACIEHRASGSGTAVFSSRGRFLGTISARYVDGAPSGNVAANWADTPPREAPPAIPPIVPAKPARETPANANTQSVTPKIPSWLLETAAVSLVAVDGTRFGLSVSSDRFALAIAAPGATPRKTTFTFLNSSQGTVSNSDDASRLIGTFRLGDKGLEIAYEDGHSEKFARKSDGGLLLKTVFVSGGPDCVSWYPDGHGFTTAERQAAVAAYAVRLGIGSSGAGTIPSCADSPLEAEAVSPPVEPDKPSARPHRAPKVKTALAGEDAMEATISVRDSDVHLIDPPFASPPEPERGVWRVASAPAATGASQPSECLSVAAEGASWGFRNHCGFVVSFAYCLNDSVSDPRSCRTGATAGSVAPNEFGALFAQKNMNDAEHDFRWIACDAGSGTVTPKLVRADPPAGQCLHAKAS